MSQLISPERKKAIASDKTASYVEYIELYLQLLTFAVRLAEPKRKDLITLANNMLDKAEELL